MPFPSSPSEWKKSQPRRIIKSDTVETMAEDSAGRGRAWCAKRYKRNSKECAHCFVGWLSQGRSRKNPKMLRKTRNDRAFKRKYFRLCPSCCPIARIMSQLNFSLRVCLLRSSEKVVAIHPSNLHSHTGREM